MCPLLAPSRRAGRYPQRRLLPRPYLPAGLGLGPRRTGELWGNLPSDDKLAPYSQQEEIMRAIVAVLFALALGTAFSAPGFAADPTQAKTKVECQRAGGMWDVKTNSCLRGMA